MTVVQAAWLASVGGVLLASGVPTFLRHLRLSKVTEASSNLATMHAMAATYFARTIATPEGPATRCMPRAAGPTPGRPSPEPVDVDWEAPETHDGETWRALGFAPDEPVRFSYSFEPVAAGCALRSDPGAFLVSLRAEGDLDGDGERSIFERRAGVDPSAGELIPLGVLYVRDRVE